MAPFIIFLLICHPLYSYNNFKNFKYTQNISINKKCAGKDGLDNTAETVHFCTYIVLTFVTTIKVINGSGKCGAQPLNIAALTLLQLSHTLSSLYSLNLHSVFLCV